MGNNGILELSLAFAVNSLSLERNGHFILTIWSILSNKNIGITKKMSLKCVSTSQIDGKSALAWSSDDSGQ